MSDILGPLNDLFADDDLLDAHENRRSYASEPAAAWAEWPRVTPGWVWDGFFTVDSTRNWAPIGHVEGRDGVWRAVTREGRSLGLFATQSTASWALTASRNPYATKPTPIREEA